MGYSKRNITYTVQVFQQPHQVICINAALIGTTVVVANQIQIKIAFDNLFYPSEKLSKIMSGIQSCRTFHIHSHVCLVSSGRREAGAGCRVWLPHREGETSDPQLHPHPEPHPSLHLRGPGLERILLVNSAWCWPGWGEWVQGAKSIQTGPLITFNTFYGTTCFEHKMLFVTKNMINLLQHRVVMRLLIPVRQHSIMNACFMSTCFLSFLVVSSCQQSGLGFTFSRQSRKCNAVRSFQLYLVIVNHEHFYHLPNSFQ